VGSDRSPPARSAWRSPADDQTGDDHGARDHDEDDALRTHGQPRSISDGRRARGAAGGDPTTRPRAHREDVGASQIQGTGGTVRAVLASFATWVDGLPSLVELVICFAILGALGSIPIILWLGLAVSTTPEARPRRRSRDDAASPSGS
jgi:hypothetical protein